MSRRVYTSQIADLKVPKIFVLNVYAQFQDYFYFYTKIDHDFDHSFFVNYEFNAIEITPKKN